MAGVQVKSYASVVPMIYAYTTPGVPAHDGWTKIGYTERDVDQRIREQTHTANIAYKVEWKKEARYTDGSEGYFDDHDFHDFLTQHGVEREKGTEWFRIDPKKARQYFYQFAGKDLDDGYANVPQGSTYILRKEQQEAVAQTLAYYQAGTYPREFLWNAKPRFGKTLTAYDLARQMKATRVLIVTNRPSIANSWLDDFQKFIGWQTGWKFISESDSLKGKKGYISRQQYMEDLDKMKEDAIKGEVAFESLQGLKGSIYFGGQYDKLDWIQKQKWDLLIIDEAHEGVDTYKTDVAFDKIQRKFTLHLSGTPFKAIASNKFRADQIFNWSYEDEQEAKANWDENTQGGNPYGKLPRLNLYTYQLSHMIQGQIQKGMDLSEDEHAEFAFDLNEFFRAENEKFVHEKEVKNFLNMLAHNEKYPFSTPELRKELAHTFWLMHRVESVKAMAKLLKKDPVFEHYEVVVAAGDGKLTAEEEEAEATQDNEANKKSFDKVMEAIRENDRTITLSVGQLTTGVTVKPWTAVLMLSNMKSPAEYMQAAFRAQNPYEYTDPKTKKRFQKQNAYVFDFAPERTLIIFDEFANNLNSGTVGGHGTREEREKHIRRLLNFFPVIGEDSEGRMEALDAAQVLTIPKTIKAQEVIHRGFMSNLLFANIGVVFGAPGAVKAILDKIPKAQEQPKKDTATLDDAGDVHTNAQGEVEIPGAMVINQTKNIFGEKKFEDIQQPVAKAMEKTKDQDDSHKVVANVTQAVMEKFKEASEETIKGAYNLTKNQTQRAFNHSEQQIQHALDKVADEHEIKQNVLKAEHEKKVQTAASQEEKQKLDEKLQEDLTKANQDFQQSIQETVKTALEESQKAMVQQLETQKEQKKARAIEEDVRAHLRGFSRTIPSFIMAYSEQEGTEGGRNLKLSNFDDYTPDDVFQEVTGISEEEFRFLRDGGPYTDEKTGKEMHFAGHVFDEVVFDESIQEFLNLKEKLNNYFADASDEDIFDYIPPQKTNQIFTPKNVVVKMVDALEQENPGIFDDPNRTFADLYMKSGLYITEIVKRLFRSPALKKQFPEEQARLKHILENQVFGFAPSQIIYDIAIAYIFGFDKSADGISHRNFIMTDTTPYAKEGKLDELIQEKFGNRV
ncbi:DEAD/DEAH box helicase family protein [Acidaminococcus fermentans]|uniref:DEAD/DEAH box helicase family protein n=1 Tax=Acidaminococcus fermentans TaxID=905 RepID=UPI00242DEA0C|nr:DEAD/DEAH box helicase family protein [Acidaminococcus fermentans]